MKSSASSRGARGGDPPPGLSQRLPPRSGPADPGRLGRPSKRTSRVKIRIQAYDRAGLLNEITAIFKEENINLVDASAVTARQDNLALITATDRGARCRAAQPGADADRPPAQRAGGAAAEGVTSPRPSDP